MFTISKNQMDLICQALGLPADAFSIIIWQSVACPPADGSYILVKYREDGDLFTAPATYENGLYTLQTDEVVIPRSAVLGWSYYPCDDRL